METYQTKPISVTIQPFGECTLLPLELVPTTRRSYEKLREVAITLFDLQELPRLTHEQAQDTVKVITHKLTEYGQSITFGVTVWISGTHLSYPAIDIANPEQEKELCITAVELYFWDEDEVFKKTPNQNRPHVETMYEELQPHNIRKIEDADMVYGLFLGKV